MRLNPTHIKEEVSEHDEVDENDNDVHQDVEEEVIEMDSYPGGPSNVSVLHVR